MNEQFDGMNKIYQVALPLSHGETFEIEVVNTDTYSISFLLNEGVKFATRMPKSMKNLKIGDKAKLQYFEYISNKKLYGRTKLLKLIRD